MLLSNLFRCCALKGRRFVTLYIGCAALFVVASAKADYEVPNAAYNPPSIYYNAATGTGATLKSQLYTIISTGFVSRSYGDSRYWMPLTDTDPANSSNILLIYNRASVSGIWDMGVTYNREHVWPKYWLNLTSSQVSNTYSGMASDEFELRPANTTINGNRGDSWYGFSTLRSNGAITGYGNVSSGGTTYWYPGDPDRGDVARSLFYMATRYGQGQTNNLTLANGPPGTTRYRMGDLNSLLHWNYQDGIDNFERRRNQVIYSSSLNPTYYQGNRNPYIDHPEYVWAVFGTSLSDTTLHVGSTVAGDGSSTTSVDLGRVIVGGTLSTSSVTLTKTGADPTTYDITTSGEATTTAAGVGQPFDYAAQSRSVPVALSSSTATAGAKSGTITVNNTDLTTSAPGMGSADGNDTINLSATVLAHSTASLSPSSVVKSLIIPFGTIAQAPGTTDLSFGISNLVSVANFTAGLDGDALSSSGNTSIITSTLSTFSSLTAGITKPFVASLASSTLGTYSATYTLTTSDENLSGATAGNTLSVTFTGTVKQRQWYTDTNGSWSTTGNWLGAVPNSVGDTANFLNVITAPRTITIDSAQTTRSCFVRQCQCLHDCRNRNAHALIRGRYHRQLRTSHHHRTHRPGQQRNINHRIRFRSDIRGNDFRFRNLHHRRRRIIPRLNRRSPFRAARGQFQC